MPGGRTRPLESSAAALRREMRKELGAEVTVVRLLWVVKNFFRDQGEAHHELGLYFLMSLDPGSHLYSHDGPFPGDEEGLALEFQWYPQKQSVLMHLPVSPAFLQRGLTSLPNVPQHVVHYDPDF